MSISTIQQPVTENYIYQTMISNLSYDASIIGNGVSSDSNFFLRYSNGIYENLVSNGYKYVFVYNFSLDNFINATTNNITKNEVITHDQMHLNFGASLRKFSNKRYYYVTKYTEFKRQLRPYKELASQDIYATVTIGDLYNDTNSATTYSKQYGSAGASLKDYMETVILELPDIVRGCPFDMTKTLEYHPYSYIYEYDYIDLLGNATKKIATFTAIKYTANGDKKVLFFGTGLQEYVVS